MKNLTSLRFLGLTIKEESINENLSLVFERVRSITSLNLKGCLSNFNFDSLVNLRSLRLNGNINEDFNYDLLKNVCNDLQAFESHFIFDQKQFTKLFYGLKFPSLYSLRIERSSIKKLEKKVFQEFQKLHRLKIANNHDLQTIDSDSFSSMSNLVYLDLNDNRIEKIDNRTFSSLIQLKTLNLRHNLIRFIEENTFSNLKNLSELDLSWNILLSVLNPLSFSGLENLKDLNLDRCRLSTLNPQTFIGLSNLKSLSIRNEQLGYFDLRILENLSKIEKIYLSGKSLSNKDEVLKNFKILIDI